MSQSGSLNGGGSGPTNGIQTINGDSGSVTGTNVTIFAGRSTNNSGSTVGFDNSGTISTLNVTDINLNTIIGKDSGNATISGQNNTSLGNGSLPALTSGSSNTAIGQSAQSFNQTGVGNTSLGAGSLAQLISGDENTAIGQGTMSVSNGVYSCTAVGTNALRNNSANFNTAIGGNALTACTTGTNNTAVGYNSCIAIDIADNNVGVGNSSLSNLLDGDNNIGIGSSAGQGINSGSSNVCIGLGTMSQPTSSSQCIAIGSNALRDCESNNNVSIGVTSFQELTTGVGNTGLGATVGSLLKTGSQNIFLGFGAGVFLSGAESNNIMINSNGVLGDNDTTRIGTTQTRFFAAGIAGASVSNSKQVYINTTTGQLGSIALDNQSDTIAIRSTLIDMTQLGTTTLFTPEANFIVTGFTAYAQTITGTAGTPVANFGWTNPLYNDTLTGYTTFSPTQGNYNNFALSGSNVPVVPASTPFVINVTTADVVATANVQRIDILGYYLN